MRKLFLIIAMSAVFLCGCQKSEATADYKDIILKAQKITVIAADTSETVAVITEKDEIEAFVASLKLDKWTLEELPENVKEVGSFALSQEATIELGQTETDGTLYDVCKITLYDNSYIDVEAAGLTMTFKINEEPQNYLNGYF